MTLALDGQVVRERRVLQTLLGLTFFCLEVTACSEAPPDWPSHEQEKSAHFRYWVRDDDASTCSGITDELNATAPRCLPTCRAWKATKRSPTTSFATRRSLARTARAANEMASSFSVNETTACSRTTKAQADVRHGQGPNSQPHVLSLQTGSLRLFVQSWAPSKQLREQTP
jgi:hypothetical protein